MLRSMLVPPDLVTPVLTLLVSLLWSLVPREMPALDTGLLFSFQECTPGLSVL